MRRTGKNCTRRFRPSARRHHILRWVLLALCVLAVLGFLYGCAVQQLVYSARGTVIFLPELSA